MPVTNYKKTFFFRLDFFVGIAYEDDINGTKKEIMEVLKNHKDLISDSEHENFVVENELATSTVNLKVLFWENTTDFIKAAFVTNNEVMNLVKKHVIEKGYSLSSDIQ